MSFIQVIVNFNRRFGAAGGNDSLRRFSVDRGYLVHVTEPASVLLRGRIPRSPRNVSLQPGWNPRDHRLR